MKKVEAHKHYWLGENRQHFPEFETIIRMHDPRVFIRFRTDLAMFAGFDEFVGSIAEIQWIDGKPNEDMQLEILTDAWNFLAIEERILEDDLADMEEDEDYD